MRRFATRPNQSSLVEMPEETGDIEPIDVQKLLDKGGEILRREIANLMSESSSKKLAPASARDLVAYIKLLSELLAAQKQELANMSDEDLQKLAKGNL